MFISLQILVSQQQKIKLGNWKSKNSVFLKKMSITLQPINLKDLVMAHNAHYLCVINWNNQKKMSILKGIVSLQGDKDG